MYKIFLAIYRFFVKNKFVFYLALMASFVFVGYFAFKIDLEEDISKFLPADKKIEKINYAFQNINIADKLIINISLEDSSIVNPEKLIEIAEILVDSLSIDEKSEFIKSIKSKIEEEAIFEIYNSIQEHLPLFLDNSDYLRIDSLINPDKIDVLLENNKKMLVSPASIFLKKIISNDPLNITPIALQKLKSLQVSNNYEIYDGYIFANNQKNLLIFITSAFPTNETSMNGKLVDFLDNTIKDILLLDKSVNIEYFGAIAVGVGNARQIKQDSLITSIFAILLIIILLTFYFRRLDVIFLIILPVLFGAGFSLSLLHFIKGELSAIALGAGAAIFGIAVNYSLHVFAHYKHKISVADVFKDITNPLVIGSLTTVGAFLSLLFVKSPALQDFGLFSALSLIGAILFSLIFLPQFLHRKTEVQLVQHKFIFIEKFSTYHFEKNRILLVLILILSVILFYTATYVDFDSDMSKINYMDKKLTTAQQNVQKLSKTNNHSIYLVSSGKTLNEALKNNEIGLRKLQKLKNDSLIIRYSDISLILMTDSIQNLKINRWKNFWTSTKTDSLKNLLVLKGEKYKFRENAFTKFFNILEKDYQPISVDSLKKIVNVFLDEFITQKEDISLIVSVLELDKVHTTEVFETFNDSDETFVFDKGFITRNLVDLISDDFNLVLLICSLLVLVFLTISFGRIELGFIAFVPMFLSWVWILGLMGLFGVKFNIINIIISTFIFGLGDDYTIFIMDGLVQEFSTKKKVLASYKTSVFLSAITMLIGIGVLVFAKHPAMKSLGIVTIIGMFTVVIISYTVSPFLFRWLTTIKGRKRYVPLTFLNLAKSVASFFVFLVGSFILTFSSIIIFNILRQRNPKGKLFFHKLIKAASKFVVDILIGVKTTVINNSNEKFDKPAIIVCNHQSHIDLVLMLMLTPKMIVLTNDWVWKSPFYGRIVRSADFYPVSSGVENSVEILKQRVSEGYSILIFPEGTRSENCSIGKFQKGAIYLAEQLGIELLPIVIHGVGHCVTKGELVLKRGSIKIHILDRINTREMHEFELFTQKAKFLRNIFVDHYNTMRKKYESAKYFRNRMIYNYIFRSTFLELYTRLLLSKEKDFASIIKEIPSNSSVLVINALYGHLPLLTSFMPEIQNVYAIESDSDKLEIAENCVSATNNLTYIDLENIELHRFDCIIIDNFGKYSQDELPKIIYRCVNQLSDNGLLILTNPGSRKKHALLRIIEKLNQIDYNENNENSLKYIDDFCRSRDLKWEKSLDLTNRLIIKIKQ